MKLRKLAFVGVSLFMATAGLLYINPQTAFAAPAHSCLWTGNGANNNFSTVGNWSNCAGAAPQAGDALYFGDVAAARHTPNNDIAASTSFDSIHVLTDGGTNFTITGNAMIITGQVSGGGAGTNTIQAQIYADDGSSMDGFVSSLDGGSFVLDNVTIINAGTVELNYITLNQLSEDSSDGTVNIGPSVAIDDTQIGNTTININDDFTTGSSFNSETTNVNNGATLTISGSPGGTIVVKDGGTLKGTTDEDGTTIVVQQGGTLAPGHSPGCISTNIVAISGIYQEEIGGASTACTDFDQLIVTSNNGVNITNGSLDAQLINGFTPTVGQVFRIIDNQGISPVLGTFNGLAEGATVHANGYDFRLSYVGGDGNDVTLTALGPTPATPATTNPPGSPNTGLAALTAHPLATLAATTVAALLILIITRRLRPAKI